MRLVSSAKQKIKGWQTFGGDTGRIENVGAKLYSYCCQAFICYHSPIAGTSAAYFRCQRWKIFKLVRWHTPASITFELGTFNVSLRFYEADFMNTRPRRAMDRVNLRFSASSVAIFDAEAMGRQCLEHARNMQCRQPSFYTGRVDFTFTT